MDPNARLLRSYEILFTQMIYADQRWIGDHGIGRFARKVLAQLDYRPISLASHPAAPLDSWFLARALRGLARTDLFFSPGYNTPLFCPAPFVFVIHDLSHIYCPENSSSAIRLYYDTIMKRACRRAIKILTVSDFTRQQIIDWAGVPSEKVVNVGCGIDSAYQPQGNTYGLPFPYLLCVSNRKRHKNEFRTVEAYARSGLAGNIHLVFTGNPTAELVKCNKQFGVSASIHFLGVVPEEKLPGLYRGAEALVFVSLYEGFGLPVLEAMACGIPVVTSDRTALLEIAGDDAVVVDPTSVPQVAQAMVEITTDTLLCQRLREKGPARAAQFSWVTTSEKVRLLLGENVI